MTGLFQRKVSLYAGTDADKYVRLQNALTERGVKFFSGYFDAKKYDKSRRGVTPTGFAEWGDEYGNNPPAERVSISSNGYVIEVRRRDFRRAADIARGI